MGEFSKNKRINLEAIGEGWQGCYIELSKIGTMEFSTLIPYNDKIQSKDQSEQIAAALGIYEAAKGLLSKHFIGGKGYTEQKDEQGNPILADITVEDATTDLYDEIFPIFMEFVANKGVDKNL